MKFVIMAGGFGSKLWPYSRIKTPKQFINLVGEKTLYQITVGSLLRRYEPEDIFVSVTEDLVHFVKEQTPEIPETNYIIEPMYKDTGPASCLAMAKVAAKYPDEVVYFYVQAVSVREPEDKFLDMIGEMEKLVKESGKLVTGTIIPKYAETGSDLFKMGKKTEIDKGMEVYEVGEWINVVKERMSLEQVKEISSKFTVGTHANQYTWRSREFFEAVKRIRPDWEMVLEELRMVIGQGDEKEKVTEIYAKFEPNRIEVMTTELVKEGKVMAVVLPYNWTHITTWDDVYRYREAKNIPTIEGEVIEIDGGENLIISKGKRLVSVVGMKEIVVIETDEATFIAPRSMVGRVKEVMDKLKEEKYQKFQ